jgi:hypothetical protein
MRVRIGARSGLLIEIFLLRTTACHCVPLCATALLTSVCVRVCACTRVLAFVCNCVRVRDDQVGGTVPTGSDCLQCPFHKWTFSGEGACVKIPHLPTSSQQGGQKGVPAAAAAKAWHVCEYYGMVRSHARLAYLRSPPVVLVLASHVPACRSFVFSRPFRIMVV